MATHYAIKRADAPEDLGGSFYFLQSDTEEVVGDREFSTRMGAESYRAELLKKGERR